MIMLKWNTYRTAVATLFLAVLSIGCSGGKESSEMQSTSEAVEVVETIETIAVEVTNPVALTAHGRVQGVVDDEILTFKGIRYGADTATTRFAAPSAPGAWTEVQNATQYGNSCPQTPTGNPGGLFTSWAPVPTPAKSEDCLFLNVWTPALADGGKRPVMMWFHGGGFSSGNGSSAAYEGVRLAKRGDVVVVTVNHRLNLFGYLALNHYGEGFEDSAAAGVLDMVQALEWVRDNIENFGGDPNSVMIFGESGGGAKVSTLMATPAAKGLFHRVVVQSGALIRFPEQDEVRAAADRVVANLGLTRDTIKQIKSLPVDAIQAAAKDSGAGAAPSLDGRTLTHHPFDPSAAPSGHDVPLMLGTNRTESSLFIGAVNPAAFDLTWDSLKPALKRLYPDKDVDAIITGYRELEPEATAADIFFEATTDGRWPAGHVIQATRKVEQGGAPVYLYLFDWDTPVDGGKWRSPHALEIGFVFDNVANSESMSGVGDEQQRVADIMADTWIAFARNGNPDNPKIPEWPPYNVDARPVMVLGEAPELVNDARGEQQALVDDADAYLNRYRRPPP
jgi:para-nitrobenzyl esterase